ncbi:hypothetical protein ACH5RR_015086 [Cinchona calisaya]|uniref:RNA helicase n=1 Tax=Cinchona calisaya TaxID=153742 RepID=A0ABD2ZS43_9GENT
MGSDLKNWVSDKLISILGYSNPSVVQYVISLSKRALSAMEIVNVLVEKEGFMLNTETLDFAQEIFDRVEHKAVGMNVYQQEEKEALILARKWKNYALLGDDHEDRNQVDGGIGVVNLMDMELRKENSSRKRIEIQDDDGSDVVSHMEDVIGRTVRSRISEDKSDGLDVKEEERIRDQKEREELEKNLKERDAARTRKAAELKRSAGKGRDGAVQRPNDTFVLREISRQEYLKKREQKKLKELGDDVEDEQYLFEGVKLTDAEDQDFRYKNEIYQLVKKRSEVTEITKEYRMPELYDQEGNVNQEKRFAAASKRYRDPNDENKVKPFAEQESWEENQIGKAILKFGSRDRKQKSDEFELVFENQIEFIKAEVMDGRSDKRESVELTEKSIMAKPTFDKLQDERKSLPIYRYKDKLLRAINDHQILVIVGETGSGKTTQIPQYLHEAGFTKFGKIGCTQPRRVAAMSVAARVSQEMGIKMGHEVGYSIRFEDCTCEKTVLKYMTDGILLREFLGEPDLASYSVLMVDEAHERTLSTDVLFVLVKDIARFRPDLKVLISSATLDAEKFSDYFDSAPIFYVPGRRYPVEIHNTKAPEADYLDAAVVTALQIHLTQPPGDGDILIFLTGQEEIENVEDILKYRLRGFGSKIAELIICPIYSNLPTELQAKIFEPIPQGARKVVLATNIAETSLTIDGIKYVIDPGFCKMKSYNPRTGMESLLVTPISKASADQRAGRSGRTSPGKCFRLYTAYTYYNDLEDNTVPEIKRSNLSNVVLTLKSLGIHNVVNFDFMDPPPEESILKALELLYALGALNKHGELTKVGRRMAEFPLDPMLSKMIVASDKYKCSAEIISIAAMLSVGSSIFYSPKNRKVLADNARMNFHVGNVGDHIALLNVYNSWKETDYSTQWYYENFIQVRSMKRARDIRDQLKGLLERVEIGLSSNLKDTEAIKKAIIAGFFPHSAHMQKNGLYRTIKLPQTVYIHPSSGLLHARPSWVVYHELVLTSKEYMRQVTELKPEWLVEIAPHCFKLKDVAGSDSKKQTCEGDLVS